MNPLMKRVAMVVAVAGIMLAGRLLLGASIGAPCSDAFLCNALPARCLLAASGSDGYCSRPCSDASGCEPGWACAPVERRDEDGARVDIENVCLRPGEPPGARHALKRR